MKSIQDQEIETFKKEKKKVTIITVEEEEALEKQINEIRDRIKRGETIGQQKSKERLMNKLGMNASIRS